MGGLGSSSPRPTQRCFCHETFKTAGVRAGDMMECGNMELPEPYIGTKTLLLGSVLQMLLWKRLWLNFPCSLIIDKNFVSCFDTNLIPGIICPLRYKSILAKFLLKCWWVVWWPAHQNHCHETVNTPCGSHVWNVGDVADSKVIEY